LVVEHDRETIESSDFVIDLGPRAGRHGGEVVATGSAAKIAQSKKSLTGLYLAGKLKIPTPQTRRNGKGKAIEIIGAQGNNLKNINVEFPLGKFICITGVSGSGKSTLVNETLFTALSRYFDSAKKQPLPYKEINGKSNIDKVIDLDQSPIGRTPRSNPATYTGLFAPLRDLFSQLPEAKIRGYKPGRFSFNVKGGRCEACRGQGMIKVEMHFLPDVYVHCKECGGKRYNRETMEVTYKNRNIAEVLEMTVDEAENFFENVPAIRGKLKVLKNVGLGYIRLGQPATTLSGGEAQRVKLSRELSKIATGNTIYILDEPSVGLHAHDVAKLIEALSRLVDKGVYAKFRHKIVEFSQDRHHPGTEKAVFQAEPG